MLFFGFLDPPSPKFKEPCVSHAGATALEPFASQLPYVLFLTFWMILSLFNGFVLSAGKDR